MKAFSARSLVNAAAVAALLVCAGASAHAQDFTVLHAFSGPDGASPIGGLVQDSAGNLYGTTDGGGSEGYGTIFKLDTSDNETVLLNFTTGNGAFPGSTMLLDKAGDLVAPALEGPGGSGVIFDVSTTGHEKFLYQFDGCDCNTPRVPEGGLLHDSSGRVFGVTEVGGTGNCTFGCGTVYELTGINQLKVIYSFTGGSDGNTPSGPLTEDAAGNLYGVAYNGGDLNCQQEPNYGCGTLFKIDASGNFSVLHTFSGGTDGGGPQPGLLFESDGNLYGTANYGGMNACGDESFGCGTIFRINTTTGQFTVLYTFTGAIDGEGPNGSLVTDGKGFLYGTTEDGTTNSYYGTIYRFGKKGGMDVLHSFNGNTDGALPFAGVIFGNDGALYGTAYEGFGLNGRGGTVFRVTVPQTR